MVWVTIFIRRVWVSKVDSDAPSVLLAVTKKQMTPATHVS
jgi:hypothetical protein